MATGVSVAVRLEGGSSLFFTERCFVSQRAVTTRNQHRDGQQRCGDLVCKLASTGRVTIVVSTSRELAVCYSCAVTQRVKIK